MTGRPNATVSLRNNAMASLNPVRFASVVTRSMLRFACVRNITPANPRALAVANACCIHARLAAFLAAYSAFIAAVNGFGQSAAFAGTHELVWLRPLLLPTM